MQRVHSQELEAGRLRRSQRSLELGSRQVPLAAGVQDAAALEQHAHAQLLVLVVGQLVEQRRSLVESALQPKGARHLGRQDLAVEAALGIGRVGEAALAFRRVVKVPQRVDPGLVGLRPRDRVHDRPPRQT